MADRNSSTCRTADFEKITHDAVDKLQIWHRITVCCNVWNNRKNRIFKEEFLYIVNLMDSYTEISEPTSEDDSGIYFVLILSID